MCTVKKKHREVHAAPKNLPDEFDVGLGVHLKRYVTRVYRRRLRAPDESESYY
jgi:hypothetical protein